MNQYQIFIDSDIILDVLLEREMFYEASAKLLNLGDSQKINVFTSSISITNIYYILRKELKSNKKAIDCIKDLMEIIKILPVDETTINKAMKTDFSDFEDSIQYIVAKTNGLNMLITRNKKDYKKAEVEVLDASEFLEKFNFV